MITRKEIQTILHRGKWALLDMGCLIDASQYEDAEWWVEANLSRQQYLEIAEVIRRDLVRCPEIRTVVANRSRTLLLWLMRQTAQCAPR